MVILIDTYKSEIRVFAELGFRAYNLEPALWDKPQNVVLVATEAWSDNAIA